MKLQYVQVPGTTPCSTEGDPQALPHQRAEDPDTAREPSLALHAGGASHLAPAVRGSETRLHLTKKASERR